MSEPSKVVSLNDHLRTTRRSNDDTGPSPAEGLRLIEAFRGIKDPAARRQLLETADRLRAGMASKNV